MCKADREVRPIFFNKTHYLHCTIKRHASILFRHSIHFRYLDSGQYITNLNADIIQSGFKHTQHRVIIQVLIDL